jgi:hypothetical protein
MRQEFYSQHHPDRLPAKRQNEESLGKLLVTVSKHFTEVTLIVDGLDECGAAAGIDRSRLLGVLSTLHLNISGTIRTCIASRNERDIEDRLGSFSSISISAESADLQLYVASEVRRRSGKLRFKTEDLRLEIVDTLIQGARGMSVFQDLLIDAPPFLTRFKGLCGANVKLTTCALSRMTQSDERLCRSCHPTFLQLISAFWNA